MAIEVFPDSPSAGMSPRISFSHDLSQNDIIPVEQYIRSSSSSSSVDFDFCVFRESLDQDQYSSSADELFFNGKILPIEIKKRLAPPRAAAAAAAAATTRPLRPQLPLQPLPHQNEQALHAAQTTSIEEKQNYKPTSSSSSFWRIKRSASLNCGSGTLCPLPLLSRSNSTGSTSGVKRSSLSNNQKQNFLKSSLPNSSLKQSSSNSHQKPPLKKSNSSFYSSGVKINPVLNVPPATLFGLGSIFSGGKDRSKRK